MLVNIKHKTILYWLLLNMVFVVVIAEIVLRIIGYSPGIQPSAIHSFKPTDTLWEYKGFYTDENGIFKIDTACGNEVAKRIQNQNKHIASDEAREVYNLLVDFSALLSGSVKNKLSELYFTITQKPEKERTEWEKAIVHYIQNPINKDGFRSIAFKKYNHSKPSILLLGDSFTWGHSTRNKTNSFADILLSKGYVVYNTGITTTDVAQYLAVAQKYIPELKPDIVIANFYLGNDVTYFKREPQPHQCTFYCTNAGYLLSSPHGEYLSRDEAYQLALANVQIPTNNNILEKMLIKTALGTHVIAILHDLFPSLYEDASINNPIITEYYNHVMKTKYAYPYSNYEVQKIKEISEEHGAKFILSSIPDFGYTGKKKTANDFPGLFDGMEYVEIDVNRKDYEHWSSLHFNEEGHQKYADFLEKIIKQQL